MPVVTAVEEFAKSVAAANQTETVSLSGGHEPAQRPKFTPHQRHVIVATLASLFALLAVLGGWLYYGAHLYQNCDASALGIHHIGL
jgi:hypothetical protein